MSENAIKILQDPEILLKFKKKAKLIAKRFETKMIVPLYEDIYKNALNDLSVKKNNL